MPSVERRYVLDACVLLRLAQNEPGAEKVARVLTEAKTGKLRLLMHVINLGEVVYSIGKRFGWEVALRKRAEIGLLPIAVAAFSEEVFWHAVKIKSHYSMSYADCFAAALAFKEGATLMTSDPEFEVLGDALPRLGV